MQRTIDLAALTPGQRLTLTRKAVKLRQEDVADLCKITRSRYANWETDYRSPDAGELLKFFDMYDISLDWIFRGKMTLMSQEMRDKIIAIAQGTKAPAHR